jgi:lysophospholipase L1-like esterase
LVIQTAGHFLLTLCALLGWSSEARTGELWDRYQAVMQPKSGYVPIANPGDPEKILSVGMARGMDFYQNEPEYEVLLKPNGDFQFRGSFNLTQVGQFRGLLTQEEFKGLAAYICRSDFFNLPERLAFVAPHYPTTTLVIRTTSGEKWVSDENWPADMHPTVWVIGRLIDGMLFARHLNQETAVNLVQDFTPLPLPNQLPKFFNKLNNGDPIKVVCFGDSVTGVYYHTGGRRAYTDILEQKLRSHFSANEIIAINAGVSGNTTVNALERMEQDVLAHSPDLVAVMFGLNDMTRVPRDEYRANLKTIVERCRAAGSDVVLCTPNNVVDTQDRPTEKLIQYVGVVRELAVELNLPLADCYSRFEEVRNESAQRWSFLMSDEIHPNMFGHREIAHTIDTAIVGREMINRDSPAPQPAIPHTLELIHSKQPVEVLVMPPYDTMIGKLLREVAPESALTITPWDVAGKSMAEIEDSAKAIRDNPPDWVFIAVPLDAEAGDFDAFKRHFTWTMNYALSFGLQEWDVVAVPPSFIAPVEGAAKERDGWARSLIRAQDFELIEGGGSPEAAEVALRAWLAKELRIANSE